MLFYKHDGLQPLGQDGRADQAHNLSLLSRMVIPEPRIGTFVSKQSRSMTNADGSQHVLMPRLESQFFIEDANAYENAMKLFLQTVPSIIYHESDGNFPHAARGRVQARLH